MAADKIIADLKKKNFKPIYWLEGDEPYYIDMVMDYAEHHILSESEASFNLSIFYGKDADWAAVVNACMRYPMFAEKQVVLLKEAQQMKDITKLENYVSNPLNSTIFMVSYKEKKVDGRSKLAKLLKEKGELLSTKKLYENQLPDWTERMIQEEGLSISSKALLLLVDHVGNDLSRLQNEVEKMAINLKGRKNITEDDIEEFIGISKEFNVFELQDAIARKDFPKATRIIRYFKSNPKAAPIQQILPALYGYFSKVYGIFGTPHASETTLRPLFYNNPFAAKQALQTMNSYGLRGIENILLLLHQYNLRSIGVNDTGTDDAELLKEMVVKIMTPV